MMDGDFGNVPEADELGFDEWQTDDGWSEVAAMADKMGQLGGTDDHDNVEDVLVWHDDDDGLWLEEPDYDDLCDLYTEMSKRLGGVEEFRRDYIESDSGRALIRRSLMALGKERKIDEDDVVFNNLRLFKMFGKNLLVDAGWDDLSSLPFEDERAGYDIAIKLAKAGLVDAGDLSSMYSPEHIAKIMNHDDDRAVASLTKYYDNIVLGLIDAGVEPLDDDVQGKYWYDLSKKTGRGVLGELLRGEYDAKEYETQFGEIIDFRNEVAFNVLVNAICDYKNSDHVFSNYFLDETFRAALREEKNQKMILEKINDLGSLDFRDNVLENDNGDALENDDEPVFNDIFDHPYLDDKRTHLFSLFAQDRDLLREMCDHKMFDDCTGLEGVDAVSKFLDGNYTERDRLMFFTGYDYDSGLFYEDGEPRLDFFSDALGRIDTDWNVLLRCVGRLMCVVGETRGEMRQPSLITEQNMGEYFDEFGPKLEFMQLCLDNGEYECLSECLKKDSGLAKKAQFDATTRQFLVGLSNDELLKEGEETSQDNIIALLVRFIMMDADDWGEATTSDIRIREAFGGKEAKDLASSELNRIYKNYLNGEKSEEFSVGLKALAHYMQMQGGAGPLVQIEAFLDFAGRIDGSGGEGREFTRLIEQKMDKDHWDNQDKTNFYAVSAEMLQASPEIYNVWAELFTNLPDKKEFRTFVADIYPLYRAKLALLREYEDHSDGIGDGYVTVNYDSTDISELKNQLHNALLPFNLQELSPDVRRDGINRVREAILGEISEVFQEKFGILSDVIPSMFGYRDTKVVEDLALYLSTMANPDEDKKNALGFFLALQLGGGNAWDRLRGGVEKIAPGDYLNAVSGFYVEMMLQTSRENNPLNSENLHIQDPERLNAFRSLLQTETVRMQLGNMQTVDKKLQYLKGGMQELMDLDLYPNEIDKERIELLNRYPIKTVRKVASALNQRLSGKNIPYGENEEKIADELVRVLKQNDLEVTPDNIKNYFQTGLDDVGGPFVVMGNIEKKGAMAKLAEFTGMLMPPDEIRQIFGRLGEEFKPRSGVLAFSADLDFLDNIIVKKEDELSEEEIGAVRRYLTEVRNKLAEINNIYEDLLKDFSKMKEKTLSSAAPNDVKERIREIWKGLTGDGGQSMITTTCTGDMLTIIENMRACLSCKTKGINNDTNLTFGEGYKFYLYSKGESMRESSSTDEVVFFIPVGEGDESRMGFVMDQFYGLKNSDIFISHVETVLKKARELKRQFPEVPISVVLPGSSMNSCGLLMSADELAGKLENIDKTRINEIHSAKVTVPKSGFGDHYIEFGNDFQHRAAGPHNVDGIEIVLE